MIITTEEKYIALSYLINHVSFRRGERAILRHIIKDPKLLEGLKFIDDGAHYCQRGLYIPDSDNAYEGKVMRIYTGDNLYDDPIDILEDLKNDHSELCLEIDLSDRNNNFILSVLEDNPDHPDYPELKDRDADTADMLLDYITRENELNMLRKEIDQAIDNKDVEKFNKLSEEFKEKYSNFEPVSFIKSEELY